MLLRAAGGVVLRAVRASELACPPATTWGGSSAGGTQGGRLVAGPGLCGWGAGGSGGASCRGPCQDNADPTGRSCTCSPAPPRP